MKRARLLLPRAKCPTIEIIARAHYDDEVEYITERGANKVVMGERDCEYDADAAGETPPVEEAVTG